MPTNYHCAAQYSSIIGQRSLTIIFVVFVVHKIHDFYKFAKKTRKIELLENLELYGNSHLTVIDRFHYNTISGSADLKGNVVARLTDLSLTLKVQLVAYNNHSYSLQASSAVLPHLPDPVLQVLETLSPGDVIHQHYTCICTCASRKHLIRSISHSSTVEP